MQEEVGEHLVLGFGEQGLHDLVEVATQDWLEVLLVEKVDQFVHHGVVILWLGLDGLLLLQVDSLGFVVALFVKGELV